LGRRRRHQTHTNHERWLVSYADFITLLFAFFVVMFASSQTDKAKARAISDSVSKALDKGGVQAVVHEVLGGTVDERGNGNAQMKGPGGSEPKNQPSNSAAPDQELLPKMQYLTETLKEEIKAGKLEVKHEERGLVISMNEAAFFPSGDDTIDPKAYPMIATIARLFHDSPNPIRLEGHTDSRPIHTARFRNNWELSSARGIAMLDLLTTQYGIPHDRMAVVGYADTVPKSSNDTEEGRAKNRRVDLVILNQRLAPTAAAAEPTATMNPAAPPVPAAVPPPGPKRP